MSTRKSSSMLLKFSAGETANTVSRMTIKAIGKRLGYSESQVVQYALARLRDQILLAYLPNAPDLSRSVVREIRARNAHLEKDYKPTSSLFPGL